MIANKLYKLHIDFTSCDDNKTVFKKSDIVKKCSNQDLPEGYSPVVWCRVKIIKTATSSEEDQKRMFQEGLIVFSDMYEIDELSIEPWYCNKTDIKDVMTKVKNGGMGSFMVHDSEHCRVIVVHQGPDLGCSIHLIRTDKEGLHHVMPQIRFISVKQLVGYYSKHRNFFNCTLINNHDDPNQENDYPVFKECPEAENNIELEYYGDFFPFHKHHWAKRVEKGQKITWEQYLLRVYRTIQMEGVKNGELIKCQKPSQLSSTSMSGAGSQWKLLKRDWDFLGEKKDTKEDDLKNVIKETLSFLKKVKDSKLQAQEHKQIESINLPDQPAPIELHVQHQDDTTSSQPRSRDQMLVMRHPNQHYPVRHAQSLSYHRNRQHPYSQPPNKNSQPIEAPMQDQEAQVPMVLGASGRYFYDPPVKYFQ